jgi:hypothetical protein
VRNGIRRIIGAIVIGVATFSAVAVFSAPASASWCSDKTQPPKPGLGCTD